ncbi:uncharacterized protein LOC132695668 [Cylas formicarius]|uniref:uncharacterized protein LOC132695668 n=1 Tax=Cylas formicarius TaxID=197179 RepID=UPI002958DF20|nr:uncharacterized protein LOC132695668 [Cylas formicarius]XP_060516057.1 uncharacterized protein LOC132695668 [Cylas formicarius]
MEDSNGEIDTSNWVVVETAEEAILLNQNGSDSDLDSDGSISIISEIPAESYSEDDDFQSKVDDEPQELTIIDQSKVSPINKELHPAYVEEDTELNSSGVAKIQVPSASSTCDSDSCESLSDTAMESSSVDTKSRLDAETDVNSSQKRRFDSTVQNSEMNNLPVSIIQTHITGAEQENNPLNLPLKLTININNNGILVGVIILLASIIIRQYLTDSKQYHLDAENFESPGKNYLIEEALGFCIQKHIASTFNKRSTKVDKCVEKRIRKIHKTDIWKDEEQYLQLKEKWFDMVQNRQFENLIKQKNFEDTDKSKGKRTYQENKKEKPHQNSFSCDKGSDKFMKNSEKRKYDKAKEKSRYNREKYNKFEKKNKKCETNRFEGTNTKIIKENSAENFRKMVQTEKKMFKEKNTKIKKATFSDAEKGKNPYKYMLQNVKTVKSNFIEKPKIHMKNKQSKDGKYNFNSMPNEWYIKFNPVQDTVELINISKNEDQRFILTENSNKTVNGQWYVNLNLARSQFRKNDNTANWYFDRATYRDAKRNKAKWYFDYMTGREENRYQI